jgi:hypothetical protein
MRFSEFATLYRYEKTGELNGLTRVRALTQDDCHTFCTEEQIESEFSLNLKLIPKLMPKHSRTPRLPVPKINVKLKNWAASTLLAPSATSRGGLIISSVAVQGVKAIKVRRGFIFRSKMTLCAFLALNVFHRL